MKILKYFLATITFTSVLAISVHAQPSLRVTSGKIALADFSPTEKKYALFIDSLDKKLKLQPKDTTAIFYRALFYLQFNSFIVKPDMNTNEATGKLLMAERLITKGDSLKMSSLNFRILRAQLHSELAIRYSSIGTWRFTEKQLAERKKKYDYFKGLTNNDYDGLSRSDPKNAYDYERLKIK